MRHLVLSVAALSICCVTAGPTEARGTAQAAPDPVASSPTTTTAVEAAAEYAITSYVDESTRTHGVVCLELAGDENPGTVLGRLAPLASRLSVDRKDCLGRDEPSAILSIGPSQIAGDRARVDVGVVLGSAGMLELERRDGAWTVVHVTRPWISLR
jgi:hypothetical protein